MSKYFCMCLMFISFFGPEIKVSRTKKNCIKVEPIETNNKDPLKVKMVNKN